jgi:hypothetical protein
MGSPTKRSNRRGLMDLGTYPMEEINPNADLSYIPKVDDAVCIPCEVTVRVSKDGKKQWSNPISLSGVVIAVNPSTQMARVLVKAGPSTYQEMPFGWAELSLAERPAGSAVH